MEKWTPIHETAPDCPLDIVCLSVAHCIPKETEADDVNGSQTETDVVSER